MREFTFISCFVCHPDTASILQAIRVLCEAEGMTSLPTPPAKAFHHAPALQNNRWQIEVLVGESGWHFLLTTPWNLLAQRAEGTSACRLVQLAHMLKTGAFLLCKYDNYPAEHGEVLLETNGPQGYTVVTGHWATTAPEIPVKEGTTEIDYEAEVDWDGDADFYGTPLRERGGHVKAQSQLLQKLWNEHNEVDWSNP